MSCEQARTIISDLYNSPEVNDCIKKVVDRGPRDDFKQELYVILLEYPCDKIVEVSNQGKIKYFVARIIINLFNQERNVFQKKYLNNKIDYDTEKVLYHSLPPSDYNHMEERKRREDVEDIILEGAEGIDERMGNDSFPYYENLIQALKKHGSMREVSRELGIPIASISMAIKRVRTHLKDNL